MDLGDISGEGACEPTKMQLRKKDRQSVCLCLTLCDLFKLHQHNVLSQFIFYPQTLYP